MDQMHLQMIFTVACTLSIGMVGMVMSQGPQKIINSIGMRLVLIPNGTFMMGSPTREAMRDRDEKRHQVTISKDYYLGAFQVTQAQYEKVMGANPSFFQGEAALHQSGRTIEEEELSPADSSNHPVDNVSWEHAVEFCRKLSELPEEKKAGRVYRLPTEAEWEYACRAGSQTAFHFGDDPGSLGDYGWFKGNSGNQTHPVGQKKPNAWGLYDMHGNVSEWCNDWYGAYPRGAVTDPCGPKKGGDRVLRGGNWSIDAASGRSAGRGRCFPLHRFYVYGFRVALRSPRNFSKSETLIEKRKGKSKKLSPYETLLAMPLEERIEAVARDVRERSDKFRNIDPQDLAWLLEVPLYDLDGLTWPNWDWLYYIKKQSLQKYVRDYENLGEMIEENKHQFDKRRFSMLMKKKEELNDAAMLKLLTEKETRLLTHAYRIVDLESCLNGDRANLVAYYYVQPASGEDLTFEATFDGFCSFDNGTIQGPYDQRDGKFVVLKNCFGKFEKGESYWESDSAGKLHWFDQE
jgi:formylglycine-generating enzyme required for sulfatase activity